MKMDNIVKEILEFGYIFQRFFVKVFFFLLNRLKNILLIDKIQKVYFSYFLEIIDNFI